MRIMISKDEQTSLGIRSRFWHQLTVKERELVTLYREHRNMRAENLQHSLRHRFQFELSKNRVLKNIGDVEYQRPEKELSTSNRIVRQRVLGFKGTEFQFNQAGQPTTYPFFECEEWVDTRFEDNETYFRNSDDLGWLMGWSPQSLGLGGQFPREMMVGTPTASIRVMTGYDLLLFQSKTMFETIGPYSGAVNHLINYSCGDKGSSITASSKKDPKLAQKCSDYLAIWTEKIKFQQKLRHSCNHLLVQGIFLPRRWKNGTITLMDPTWLRGLHNEIGQNPWSYGVFSPNWPYETETVGAYHLWYPSNEHETVSPLEMCMGKLDTSTSQPSSGKRGVPLSYRIRPMLPLLETLIQAMGTGEIRRQRITGVASAELADKTAMREVINALNSPIMNAASNGEWDNRIDSGGYSYDEASGFIGTPQSIKFSKIIEGTNPSDSAVTAYNKIATVCANSTGLAPWMWGADFKDASRATSLTAAEPSVKTGKAIQAILGETWESMAHSELILNAQLPVTAEQLEAAGIRLHVEMPNVEVRNMEELYERLSKQMHDHLKSPQHVAAEMGDDFEEEQELFEQAEASGWQLSVDSQSNVNMDGDELNKVEASDKRQNKDK